MAKEILILPLALCIYLWIAGAVPLEHLIYVLGAMAVLNLFVATLGLHAGLAYTNSRNAVAVSLGTVFFLFVGVAACMLGVHYASSAGGGKRHVATELSKDPPENPAQCFSISELARWRSLSLSTDFAPGAG